MAADRRAAAGNYRGRKPGTGAPPQAGLGSCRPRRCRWGRGQASEQEKRALTLAGIVKTVGTTVVVIIAIMMGLQEIGLDITPITPARV